jgi:hypothetical protein
MSWLEIALEHENRCLEEPPREVGGEQRHPGFRATPRSLLRLLHSQIALGLLRDPVPASNAGHQAFRIELERIAVSV